MHLKNAYQTQLQRLKEVIPQTADIDTRVLLCHALNQSFENIISSFDTSILEKDYTHFCQLIERRINLEPIAYITLNKEFYGRDFFINSNVLIPRPETELIVEWSIKVLKNVKNPSILDLGTGSGCILCSILSEIPTSTGIGIDISNLSLEVARKNIEFLNLQKRAKLLQSNWYDNLPSYQFDLIISNPPYIAEEEVNLMAEETKKFEPVKALYSADYGLADYKEIVKRAGIFLSPNGYIIVEIGLNQADSVTEIFKLEGFKRINLLKDLAGHNRGLVFQKDI